MKRSAQNAHTAMLIRLADAHPHLRSELLPLIHDHTNPPSAKYASLVKKAYRSLDEVLADPAVELVDLCVPTPQHVPQAVAALRAGKHVVCEKPLARTAEQASRLRGLLSQPTGGTAADWLARQL